MHEITSNGTAKRLLHGLVRHGKLRRDRTASIEAVLRSLPRDRKGEGRDVLKLLLRHEIVAKKPSNGRGHLYMTPAGAPDCTPSALAARPAAGPAGPLFPTRRNTMFGQITSPQPRPHKHHRGHRDLYPVGRFTRSYAVCLVPMFGTLVVSIEKLVPLGLFVYVGCGH